MSAVTVEPQILERLKELEARESKAIVNRKKACKTYYEKKWKKDPSLMTEEEREAFGNKRKERNKKALERYYKNAEKYKATAQKRYYKLKEQAAASN